jgi:hypothetical protein
MIYLLSFIQLILFRNTPCKKLLSSEHPRAKDLYDFITYCSENKDWYRNNHEQIHLVDGGIRIQGLTFCLDNESALDNEVDIWNNRGNTYFTFDAAQRHAAEQGMRVPTDAEWQKLDDFLPKGEAFDFCINVLKMPLAGYRSTVDSSFYFRGFNGYIWSSSSFDDASSAYGRGMSYSYSAFYRNSVNKTDCLSVRCVKD